MQGSKNCKGWRTELSFSTAMAVSPESSQRVLLVPFMAQGHFIPFLDLADLLIRHRHPRHHPSQRRKAPVVDPPGLPHPLPRASLLRLRPRPPTRHRPCPLHAHLGLRHRDAAGSLRTLGLRHRGGRPAPPSPITRSGGRWRRRGSSKYPTPPSPPAALLGRRSSWHRGFTRPTSTPTPTPSACRASPRASSSTAPSCRRRHAGSRQPIPLPFSRGGSCLRPSNPTPCSAIRWRRSKKRGGVGVGEEGLEMRKKAGKIARVFKSCAMDGGSLERSVSELMSKFFGGKHI